MVNLDQMQNSDGEESDETGNSCSAVDEDKVRVIKYLYGFGTRNTMHENACPVI